jgi:hypothetical protein
VKTLLIQGVCEEAGLDPSMLASVPMTTAACAAKFTANTDTKATKGLKRPLATLAFCSLMLISMLI